MTSKPAALIPTQLCLMYAITLICEEGCQWKPNTWTSAFLSNTLRCNLAQQKKAPKHTKLDSSEWEGFCLLPLQRGVTATALQLTAQGVQKQGQEAWAFSDLRGLSWLPNKGKALSCRKWNCDLDKDNRLQPQVKWSRSTMSATYR